MTEPNRATTMDVPPQPVSADEVAQWRATARTAVSSLRTIGSVLVVVAALDAAVVSELRLPRPTRVMADAAAALVLAGPGLLYHAAALLIRWRDLAVAAVAQWAAIGQTAVAAVVVAAAAVGRRSDWGTALQPVLFPAVAALCFAPALLVQAWQIADTLRRLRQFTTGHRGFEVRVGPGPEADGHDRS